MSVIVISLLGILFFSSSITALPHVFATITYAQFSPSDNVVATYTFYTVKFVLGTTATISNIVLTWPSGYNVATEKFVFNNGVPFGTTTATNGPPVTITYCFGSAACTTGGGTPTSESSGDVVTFMFANIENPTTAGSYTPTSICTYDLTTKVECQTTIPSITISDITSADLASSITIAALTTGTLSDTGTLSITGAATFASTVTSTGLLTANGGISTTTLTASGAISASGGLFGVSSSGLITTPSVNFNSFAGGALPNSGVESHTTTTTTGTIAPGRTATAIVLVMVDLKSTSSLGDDVNETLTSTMTGITISPESTHFFFVPADEENTVTFVYTVTGLTSTSSGTFTSTLSSLPSSYTIFDNYIQVILLPS